MKFVLSTHNHNKVKEFNFILNSSSENQWIELHSLDEFHISDEPEENGSSFMDNAIIKAKFGLEKTGIASISDDSGIEVDYLNKEPGIYSARYAKMNGWPSSNENNNKLLLEKLKGVPFEKRTARYVAAIVCVMENGDIIKAEGTTEGYVLFEPDGNGGFGYDPIFFSNDLQKSFGVATAEEKNQVSHRYRALKLLKEKLVAYLENKQ